jgi:hypothetical protein
MAQGTAAQRAACAPDAVKLCPDTIPDVARTKACMLRHESELSQRCRAVFNSAVNNAPNAATQGPAEESETGDAADIARARVLIGRLCRHDVLDPGTCAVTSNALDLAQ